MIDPKPRPNRAMYIEILKRMTPGDRLLKAFELTEFSRKLLKAGLRHRFPELSDEELHHRYLDVLDRCHNRNS